MIGGKALDRVVVVLGAGQGSGVLLDRRHVLTARHVVERGPVRAIHPSERTPVACTVHWESEDVDMALLRADRPLVGAARAAPMGELRVGRVATAEPLPHCQIVGFPGIQRYGEEGEDLEYDQYRVSVLPMAGRMRKVLVCELDRPAADEAGRPGSPLQGLSGAPVFAGAVLLGIVTGIPRDRLHLRVEATPFEALVKATADASTRVYAKIENVVDTHPRDERFEDRYAADLSSRYRKTEIFGIDELGRGDTRWDLDTAYLSLEAEPAYRSDDHRDERLEPGVRAQRVDTLLTERPRVLLRGAAGAGKTTLVWWLAAHAANATLNEHLATLNGLIPFVVPLREVHARGGRFPALSDLLTAGRVLTDSAPSGWVGRVLEAGRGLLLVDGLDEVPEGEREEARRWLAALLDRYPLTRCLATVRPDAVEKDWLTQDGFTELTLLPMSDDDIGAFVRAWHGAARLECEHVFAGGRLAGEQELLHTLEEGLLHQLHENDALRALARTPLLCAVICALHRRRRGLLPTTRWSLYRAALAMLLGGRDAGRGVRDTDDLTLDSEEQHALLQRMAIWLVRTGQQQMTHVVAAQQLALAMRDMPRIRSQATPERVLRFLLERSGLLQERTDDAIQFIHRTFQEFLAAKEFHESGYVLELLDRAEKEEWQDVIVLAVGHATRRDAHQLIEGLVERGEAAEGRGRRRHLLTLAARCVTSLLSVDATLSDRVRECLRELLPPMNSKEATDVSGLGDWVVDLLPTPDPSDELAARLTVNALGLIRSPLARAALKAFASHPDAAARQGVVYAWDFHPVEAFAREVLAGVDVASLQVDSVAKLRCLPLLGSVRDIHLSAPASAAELNACLPTAGTRLLALTAGRELENLGFLRLQADLRRLVLGPEAAALDLSVLSALALSSLTLHLGEAPGTRLAVLPELVSLRTLALSGEPEGGWARLTALPGVRELTMTTRGPGWLAALSGWTDLESLSVYGGGRYVADTLKAVGAMPSVTELSLQVPSLSDLRVPVPLRHVRSLRLVGVEDPAGTAGLRRTFPALREFFLESHPGGRSPETVDLRPLLDLPDLEVELRGFTRERLTVLGAQELGARLSDGLLS
ncbi:NACHT domain-containing protein [Streptomyces ziwulingensis]|uniref:NACHT domain-containing protein n=1 Tax=Streptomyces ziwulingensis TaxID=1045501 RepID=A0ABP9BFM6_9ACTN